MGINYLKHNNCYVFWFHEINHITKLITGDNK